MQRKPKRTIELVLLDRVGVISAKELVQLPTHKWVHLRQMITDAHKSNPSNDLAKCLLCGCPVFIQSKHLDGRKLPLFVHYGGAEHCPWSSGKTIHPKAARASQYQGNQESPAHRLLCDQVAKLAELDVRVSSATVSRYLPPTENAYGRFPDVLIQRHDGSRYAIEIQLSNTFQTEISERCLHYERENVPLIWLLLGTDFPQGPASQSFQDVIMRHRGNAFVLDMAAYAESKRRQKLIVKCYLQIDDSAFDAGQLVDLDDLTIPRSNVPYWKDCLTPLLLGKAESAREPWRIALRQRSPELDYDDFDQQPFLEANDNLCDRVEGLRKWQTQNRHGRWLFANLIAVAFSLLSYAAGRFRNYATHQPNVQGLMNSKLPSENMLPFATIMKTLLTQTAANSLLDGSVGKHLQRALADSQSEGLECCPVLWAAVSELFPEVFDRLLRLQLQELGELPPWATPSEPPLE